MWNLTYSLLCKISSLRWFLEPAILVLFVTGANVYGQPSQEPAPLPIPIPTPVASQPDSIRNGFETDERLRVLVRQVIEEVKIQALQKRAEERLKKRAKEAH